MDDFTTEMLLCDDDGIVDLELLCWMRALGGHPAYDGPAFPCTGSAHLGDQHVRCTGEFHLSRIPDPQPWLAARRRDAAHVALLASETIAFLADAPRDDPQVASLLESAAAAERVAHRLYSERGIPLDKIIVGSAATSIFAAS